MTRRHTEDRDDRELLQRAAQGCAASFAVLAQRYRPLLARVLSRRRVAGADTEDLVQETLARAMTGIRSYDPARPFAAWLTTIAVRVAATHQRSRREVPVGDIDQLAVLPSPAGEPAGATGMEGLWEAARQILPARQYEALRLRYGGDMSVRQVAASMGITGIHVKVLLYRARRRLLASVRFCRAFGRLDDDGGTA